MPFPLMAVGLGLEAAGLVSKLFGKSEDQRYQDHINQAVKQVAALKQKALTEGGSRIARQTASNIAGGRQSAGRRALSLGRSGDAESFIAPVEERASSTGAEALRGYIEDTNRRYDQAEIDLRTGHALAPLEPDAGDYLSTIGTGLAGYGMDRDLARIEKQGLGGDNPLDQTTGDWLKDVPSPGGGGFQDSGLGGGGDSGFGLTTGGNSISGDLVKNTYGKSKKDIYGRPLTAMKQQTGSGLLLS